MPPAQEELELQRQDLARSRQMEQGEDGRAYEASAGSATAVRCTVIRSQLHAHTQKNQPIHLGIHGYRCIDDIRMCVSTMWQLSPSNACTSALDSRMAARCWSGMPCCTKVPWHWCVLHRAVVSNKQPARFRPEWELLEP